MMKLVGASYGRTIEKSLLLQILQYLYSSILNPYKYINMIGAKYAKTYGQLLLHHIGSTGMVDVWVGYTKDIFFWSTITLALISIRELSNCAPKEYVQRHSADCISLVYI